MKRLLVPLAGLWLLPISAQGVPLISEVLYDAVGSDNAQSFVELYGVPGTPLDGFVLEGVNGSNGAVGPVVSLSGSIPADGLFVVADDAGDGTTLVPDADLLANFDFQNGPDSIVLRDDQGLVLDAVGYGVFAPDEVFAGEGTPAEDPPADSSLARLFANLDTDDNALDFAPLGVPSPGTAPVAVPEPGAGALLCVGLAGLARAGRRRSIGACGAKRRSEAA